MKSVLVVDDDPEVLQFTASTLTRGGVKAIRAHSGEEALSIFRERHREIRLLLTDIVMPKISGIELAEAIKAIDPKLKVIFMTGYLHDHLEQFGEAMKSHKILTKPFTPAELLSAVNNGLHGAADLKAIKV